MKDYPSQRQTYAENVELAISEIIKDFRIEKNKSPLFKKKTELQGMNNEQLAEMRRKEKKKLDKIKDGLVAKYAKKHNISKNYINAVLGDNVCDEEKESESEETE